jgi:hypothetical protein
MIRRGQPWGIPADMSDDVLVVESDQVLSNTERTCRIVLTGGDISRSLGNPVVPVVGSACTEVAIDAMLCDITTTDGRSILAVAASSIIVGDFWRGRHLIVSNAGWIGNSNVAPRAHPNDGKVEVFTITSQMSLRQRFLARRKMQTGTHLPHPDLSSKQIATQSIVRQNGEKLMIDGRKIDNWASISIRVEPDYWRVLV